MEAFLKAALSSGDEPTKCHICQAESVEDCMLLQRRKQREEEAKEAFIKASAAAAAAGDADESKTSSAAVSVPGKWDMLWDESAHAIFAKHRRLADLPFPDTLITVLDTDTVEAGLETLVEHHLSSVPVINSAGAAVGFLDVADLCTVVLRAYENAGAATGDVFANLRTLLMHAKLISTPIHEVMGISGNDPFLALEDRSPLLQAVCILGDKVAPKVGDTPINVHRLAVVDAETGAPTKVVSQSAILRYLEEHHAELGSILDAHVKDSCGVQASRKKSHVITAKGDDPILKTLAKMQSMRISGLPVVDKKGHIVSHVSNFDPAALLGAGKMVDFATMTTETFSEAAHKVRFAAQSAAMKLRHRPLGMAGAVLVNLDDSLAYVLHSMVHRRVHRVFVMDETHHPVGVISAHDLLRELVVKFEVPTELRSSKHPRPHGGVDEEETKK